MGGCPQVGQENSPCQRHCARHTLVMKATGGLEAGGKAQRTRERLLRAAGAEFGEHGYDGATIEGIAVHAELTRPLVHQYFATKPAVYREAVAYLIAPTLAAATAEARQAPDIATRLLTFLVGFTGLSSADRSLALFMATWVLESCRHPDLLPPEDDAMCASRAFVSWAVREAVRCGEWGADTDIAGAVSALVTVIYGFGMCSGCCRSIDISGAVHAFELLMTNKLWRVTNSAVSGRGAGLS